MTEKFTYSVSETAKHLSVSERYVRQLIQGGVLGSMKIGRRRVVSRGHIRDFLMRRDISRVV